MGDEMKAIVYREYGSPDNLELTDIPKPTVGDGDVLINVRVSTVNQIDLHFLNGDLALVRLMQGLTKPRNPVLGSDVAGVVEEVGAGVTAVKPGDEVFGMTVCESFAEYVCVSEDKMVIARKPANVSFEEAAAIPVTGHTALNCLCGLGGLESGQRVLVNGASGGVGTVAVQIAKAYSAHVTGVCSTRNLDMVRSIGADEVIDYTQDDFTQTVDGYDLIFDAVAKRTFQECTPALRPGGRYVTTWFTLPLLVRSWFPASGGRRLVPMIPVAKDAPERLETLRGLLESGRIKPVIGSRFDLAGVPDALRQMAEGHNQGKSVVNVAAV
jgi:NADPH:quinone reductase-like Zn-dependent oxidoreductase